MGANNDENFLKCLSAQLAQSRLPQNLQFDVGCNVYVCGGEGGSGGKGGWRKLLVFMFFCSVARQLLSGPTERYVSQPANSVACYIS